MSPGSGRLSVGRPVWQQSDELDMAVASSSSAWAPPRSLPRIVDGASRRVVACQYTLRRTTVPRGATTAPAGRTTGAVTTGAVATTAAPPAATQPARTTPRAQTTALASMVLRARKLPASNTGIIRCFMTALLGCYLWFGQLRIVWRRGRCRLGRRGDCRSLRKRCTPVVNQALQPVGCHIQCDSIDRTLVSGSGFGALRF
jgi:hypothetical protein